MKKLVTPIPQNTTELATPAPVSWIILTFVLSYLLNLSLSRYAWTPDFLALSMVFWVVHQPRRAGMTVAFVCGILMDVHNGSVLGQQALVYVILTYCAFSLHRRLPWFNLVGQALHVLPLLLLSQVIVLLFRLWFDGLWPGFGWFLQSIAGAILWPLWVAILSRFFRYTAVQRNH